MPRQKRTYRALEKAELRMYGLKAIDPSMDFGDARSLQNITQIIQQYRSKIEAYNTTLAVIDSYKNEMKELETTLSDLTEKMLLGVAFKYGKDSHEYEMAGGVRKSDRVRRSLVSRLKTGTEQVSTNNTQTV
ncbi:MAG: hypothetical protein V7K26_03500 [Nostoc sp.]|uniref:hypothetical protein n=1 Tax=unclassified Nostoc TaxID=2593658 RepID=UPI000B959CA7|nr:MULTISPECIES: hypothetical protein [unclassified Nostoc]OYD91202.1 hypothetical protein CDG76_28575 [Nostoc sp. 'Peltigera membranacea cyanobiont' 210A]PHM07214.1 hypothetical protein CK516_28440 [Nostoc sp. 'Peltigera malacea cyanobiont' DB3992]